MNLLNSNQKLSKGLIIYAKKEILSSNYYLAIILRNNKEYTNSYYIKYINQLNCKEIFSSLKNNYLLDKYQDEILISLDSILLFNHLFNFNYSIQINTTNNLDTNSSNNNSKLDNNSLNIKSDNDNNSNITTNNNSVLYSINDEVIIMKKYINNKNHIQNQVLYGRIYSYNSNNTYIINILKQIPEKSQNSEINNKNLNFLNNFQSSSEISLEFIDKFIENDENFLPLTFLINVSPSDILKYNKKIYEELLKIEELNKVTTNTNSTNNNTTKSITSTSLTSTSTSLTTSSTQIPNSVSTSTSDHSSSSNTISTTNSVSNNNNSNNSLTLKDYLSSKIDAVIDEVASTPPVKSSLESSLITSSPSNSSTKLSSNTILSSNNSQEVVDVDEFSNLNKNSSKNNESISSSTTTLSSSSSISTTDPSITSSSTSSSSSNNSVEKDILDTRVSLQLDNSNGLTLNSELSLNKLEDSLTSSENFDLKNNENIDNEIKQDSPSLPPSTSSLSPSPPISSSSQTIIATPPVIEKDKNSFSRFKKKKKIFDLSFLDNEESNINSNETLKLESNTPSPPRDIYGAPLVYNDRDSLDQCDSYSDNSSNDHYYSSTYIYEVGSASEVSSRYNSPRRSAASSLHGSPRRSRSPSPYSPRRPRTPTSPINTISDTVSRSLTFDQYTTNNRYSDESDSKSILFFSPLKSYENNEKKTSKIKKFTPINSSNLSSSQSFFEELFIESNYQEKGDYYPAKISSYNRDNDTYNLDYFNGMKEYNVDSKNIRSISSDDLYKPDSKYFTPTKSYYYDHNNLPTSPISYNRYSNNSYISPTPPSSSPSQSPNFRSNRANRFSSYDYSSNYNRNIDDNQYTTNSSSSSYSFSSSSSSYPSYYYSDFNRNISSSYSSSYQDMKNSTFNSRRNRFYYDESDDKLSYSINLDNKLNIEDEKKYDSDIKY